MSSLLKFFKSSTSNDSTQQKEETVIDRLSNPHESSEHRVSTARENFFAQQDYLFSTDEYGACLASLWTEFESKYDLSEKIACMHRVKESLISSRKQSSTAQDRGSIGYSRTRGHPTAFLSAISDFMTQLSSQVHPSTSDVVNFLQDFFSSDKEVVQSDGSRASIEILKKEALIASLETLSTLALWHHNCTILSTYGENNTFCRHVCAIARTMVNQLGNIGKTSNETAGFAQSGDCQSCLQFVLQALRPIVQLISRSCVSCLAEVVDAVSPETYTSDCKRNDMVQAFGRENVILCLMELSTSLLPIIMSLVGPWRGNEDLEVPSELSAIQGIVINCLELHVETLLAVSCSLENQTQNSLSRFLQFQSSKRATCLDWLQQILSTTEELNVSLQRAGVTYPSASVEQVLARAALLAIEISEKVQWGIYSNQPYLSDYRDWSLRVNIVSRLFVWICKVFDVGRGGDRSSVSMAESFHSICIRCEFPNKFSESNISTSLSDVDFWPWGSAQENLESSSTTQSSLGSLLGGNSFNRESSVGEDALEMPYHLCWQRRSSSSFPEHRPDINWFKHAHSSPVWSAYFTIILQSLLGRVTVGTKKFLVRKLYLQVEWAEHFLQSLRTELHEDVLPTFQMHFIDFMAACFQRWPQETAQASIETKLWSLLFGNLFASGGDEALADLCKFSSSDEFDRGAAGAPGTPSEVSITSVTTEPTDDPPHMGTTGKKGNDCFDISLKKQGSKIFFILWTLKVEAGKEQQLRGYATCAWLTLRDAVFDLADGSSKVMQTLTAKRHSEKDSSSLSTSEDDVSSSSPIYYDDETTWIIKKFRAAGAPVTSSLSLTYQCARWLRRVIHWRHPKEYRQKCLTACLDQVSTHLEIIGLTKLSSAQSGQITREDRQFLWPSRASVIELLLALCSSDMFPNSVDWIDLFLDEAFLSTTEADFLTRTSSVDLAQGFGLTPDQMISTRGGKGRIRILESLLIDPRCRPIALKVFIRVISVCSLEWNLGEADQDGLHTKPSYQALASYVIAKLVSIVSVVILQPQCLDNLQCALLCLQSLTWMLRTDGLMQLRTLIQEFCRACDCVSSLLLGLVGLAKPNAVKTELKSSSKRRILINIARQGLSLLASLMWNNEPMKLQFSALFVQSAQALRPVPLSSAAAGTALPGDSRSSSDDAAPSVSTPTRKRKNRFVSLKDITNLLLDAEPIISVETVILLFDMLLDRPCVSSSVDLRAIQDDPLSGMFCDDNDRPKIRNHAVLPILFDLLPSSPPVVQQFILMTLNNLITGRASKVNLTTCSQTEPSVLALTLDVFTAVAEPQTQAVAVELLKSLGRHSISVAQLKYLFRKMQSDGNLRPAYNSLLVQALQGMISNDAGPKHSFVFEGFKSGLQLPPIAKWPAAKTFSFCTWLRIESPQSIAAGGTSGTFSLPPPYCPDILCLRSGRNGAGVSVSLKPRTVDSTEFQVVVTGYSEKGVACERSVRAVTPQRKEVAAIIEQDGRWHFLAFTLKIFSAGFRTKCEISGKVDDGPMVTVPMDPPHLSDPIEQPMIGDCASQLRDSTINSTLRGQMGAIYFFSDVLDDHHLNSIYSLGPGYFYSFEPFTVEYKEVLNTTTATHPTDFLDGTLTSKIFLSYNPAVWSTTSMRDTTHRNLDKFLDNTPSKNHILWNVGKHMQLFDHQSFQVDHPKNVKMHARGLNGTYRVTTRDIRMALDSLGGIKVILPIFAQFDQPRGGGETEPADVALSQAALDLLLILLESIRDGLQPRRSISELSLIGYFLEKVSKDHITAGVTETILKIYDSLAWDTSLQAAYVESVICNFRIWHRCSVPVQTQVLIWLTEFAEANHGLFRYVNKFDVPKILDILDTYYDFENSSISLKHLAHVRICLRNILYGFIRPLSPHVPDDINDLVGYIVMSAAPEAKLEGFDILKQLLTDISNAHVVPFVLLGIAKGGCLQSLAVLFAHTNPKIRLYNLLFLCYVLQLSFTQRSLPEFVFPLESKLRQRKQKKDSSAVPADTTSPAGSPGGTRNTSHDATGNSPSSPSSLLSWSSIEELGLSPAHLAGIFQFVQAQLMEGILSVSSTPDDSRREIQLIVDIMKCTMFGFVLDDVFEAVELFDSRVYGEKKEENGSEEGISYDGGRRGAGARLDVSSRLSLISSARVAVPMIFGALFQFLSHDIQSTSLRLAVVVDLKSSILSNEVNIDAVLRVPGWQHSLIDLALAERRRLNILDSEHPEVTAAIEELTKKKEKCRALIETVLNFMSELHLVAFLSGQPLMPPTIMIPDEAPTEIEALMRLQERCIGAATLYDSVSYLRKYDGDSIAFDFFVKIFRLLSSRRGDIKHTNAAAKVGTAAAVDNSGCIFHANLWLTVNLAIDFLVPPAETSDAASQSFVATPLSAPASASDSHFGEFLQNLAAAMATLVSCPSSSIFPSLPPRVLATERVGISHGAVRSEYSKGMPSPEPTTLGPFRTLSMQAVTIKLLRALYSVAGTAQLSADHFTTVMDFIRSAWTSGVEGSNLVLGTSLISSSLSTLLHSFVSSSTGIVGLERYQQLLKLTLILAAPYRRFLSMAVVLALSGSDDFSILISKQGLVAENVAVCAEEEVRVDSLVSDLIEWSTQNSESNLEIRTDRFLRMVDNYTDSATPLTAEVWGLLTKQLALSRGGPLETLESIELSYKGWSIESHDRRPMLCSPDAVECHVAGQWLTQARAEEHRIASEFSYRKAENARVHSLQERRNEIKWNSIFRDLAHERGPWAHSAGGTRQVFWMMDAHESTQRYRSKLRRNVFGTAHQIASQITQGSTFSADSSDSTDSKALWQEFLQYKNTDDKKGEGGDADEGEAGSDDEGHVHGSEARAASAAEEVDSELLLLRCDVEIISVSSNSTGGRTGGTIELYKSRVVFTRSHEAEPQRIVTNNENPEFHWVCEGLGSTVWGTADICMMYQRNYLMQFTAIELFFTSRTSVLINLFEKDRATELYKRIRSIRPPHLPTVLHRRPEIAIRANLPGTQLSLTRAWELREISNFDYLMQLNTIAGRSFNDLGQYPVFPWVLSDYESPRLDLTSPRTFRDLKWPLGAQTEKQREELEEKYAVTHQMYMENQNDEMPPFHHGSHYSNMAFVYWYLLRTEPFTSLHIWLQGGKFDKADRLFTSVDSAWKSVISNPNDVKELIPEFYCFPEFLENVNNFDLGRTQKGEQVGSIQLPPWARGVDGRVNAHDFIKRHREALECDFVSANLHDWIDLIFGYKQRPPHLNGDEACEKAFNVFFNLTYENAVNLEEIKSSNPPLYERTVRQIDNYGQTPTRLFDKAHPHRRPYDEVGIIWPIASIVQGIDTRILGGNVEMPKKVLCFEEELVSETPILLIAEMRGAKKLITVDASRIVGVHSFQVKPPDVVPPYQIKIDSAALKVATRASATAGESMSAMLNPIFSNTMVAQREFFVGVPFSSLGLQSRTNTAHSSAAGSSSHKLGRIGTPENKKSFLKLERDRVRAASEMASGADRRTQSSRSQMLSPLMKERSSTQGMSLQSPTGPSSSSSRMRTDSSASTSSTASTSSMSSSMSTSSLSSLALTSAAASPSSSYLRREGSSGGGGGGAATPSRAKPRGSISVKASSGQAYDHLLPHLFALLPDAKLLFSCGHWDSTFKVTQPESGNLVQSVLVHSEVVTCLDLASDFGQHWLVTGSRDCTAMVWEVHPERAGRPVNSQPLHVLVGHDDAVTCVAVNAELDIVVSGSDDGTLIVHNLRDGSYVRTIVLDSIGAEVAAATPTAHATQQQQQQQQQLSTKLSVQMLNISKESYIVAYCTDGHKNFLTTFTINGRHIQSINTQEKLFCMRMSEDGKVLLTGGERCLVVMRWVNTLFVAYDGPRARLDAVIDGEHLDNGPFSSPIRSLYLTQRERHLIVGLESGAVRVLAQDSDYLRRRLVHNLENIGLISYADNAP